MPLAAQVGHGRYACARERCCQQQQQQQQQQQPAGSSKQKQQRRGTSAGVLAPALVFDEYIAVGGP